MAGTGLTGFLENLKGTEMLIIALVALVVLGPERIPEMARGAGKMLAKLRTMTEGAQSELRDVMADPSMQPLKELGELAARPRQKLTEYALEAEAEERAKREAKIAEQQQDAAEKDSGDPESSDHGDTAPLDDPAEQGDAQTDGTAPEDAAPEDSAPEDSAPDGSASDDTAPEDIMTYVGRGRCRLDPGSAASHEAPRDAQGR